MLIDSRFVVTMAAAILSGLMLVFVSNASAAGVDRRATIRACFQDTDLRQIVEALLPLLGKRTLDVDPSVEGRLTLTAYEDMSPTAFRDVLEVALRPFGLVLSETNDAIQLKQAGNATVATTRWSDAVFVHVTSSKGPDATVLSSQLRLYLSLAGQVVRLDKHKLLVIVDHQPEVMRAREALGETGKWCQK